MNKQLSILLFTCLVLLSVCDNSTEPKDCAGVSGGTAFIDDCGVCINEESGLIENYLMDCAGICAGISQLDNCGNCDDDPSNDCTQDCTGLWGGNATQNECGCVDGNTGLELDFCYGCTDNQALNYNPEAYIDDESCEYSFDQFTFHNYTIADGLPFNRISCLTADQDGNIWMGNGPDHAGGLAKFDGTTWTVITEDDGLPFDRITCLTADQDGNIWMGNGEEYSGGLLVFDGSSWEVFTENVGLPYNRISCLAADGDNNIWMGDGPLNNGGLGFFGIIR